MSHNDTLLGVVNSMRFMLQNMPGHYFIKDLDSRYVEISQNVESLCQLKKEDMVGKSDIQLPWEELASQYRHNELMVINDRKMADVVELFPINQKNIFVVRSIKIPLYDQNNDVIGIMGKTYVFSQKNTMEEALKSFMIFDYKNSINANKKYNAYAMSEYPADFNLTVRETECLFLLIRGKTAKEIGKFLTISPRTVEVYVENIKRKMNAISRSDIINKAEALGMLTIIPKNMLNTSLQRSSHQWKDFFNN